VRTGVQINYAGLRYDGPLKRQFALLLAAFLIKLENSAGPSGVWEKFSLGGASGKECWIPWKLGYFSVGQTLSY